MITIINLFLYIIKHMSKNKKLGNQGEGFAAKWLMKKGIRVLDKNIHAQRGEIDIVAYDWRQKIYIMVEVKTRRSTYFGHGIESITLQKLQKIERAAVDYFLKQKKLPQIPEFVIHAMILTPNPKTGWWQPEFLVEYYEDLS